MELTHIHLKSSKHVPQKKLSKATVINPPTESCHRTQLSLLGIVLNFFSASLGAFRCGSYCAHPCLWLLRAVCKLSTVPFLFCHFECLWNQTPKSFWMFMFQRIRIIGVHSSNTTRLLGLKDCLTLPIDMPRSISSVCLLPLLQKFDFLIGEMYRLWEWHYLCCWSEEAWLRNFRLTKIAE